MTTAVRRRIATPCVVRSPGAPVVDGNGDPVTDDMGSPVVGSPTTRATVWDVQRVRVTENRDGGVTTTDTLIACFLPEDGPLLTGDATVECTAGRFTLAGPAWPAANPRTRVATHYEATVERVQ